jgi:hypothetical protein
MRGFQSVFAIAFAMAAGAWGEDVVFHDTRLSTLDESKEARVDLTISDTRLTIEEPKESPVEVPYSSIQKMTYEFDRHHRIFGGALVSVLSPAAGIIMMSTKTKSHWLVVEYDPGNGLKTVVLRLDKSNYQKVLTALESKSGKQVDSLTAKTVAIDPTVGSKNIDEILPVRIDEIAAALKPAMEMYGCRVTKEQPTRIECRRGHGNSAGTGMGGEFVIATLEASAGQTRIRLKTSKSPLSRNWSTPIYDQMRANLGPVAP